MCLGIPGRIVEIVDRDSYIAKVDVSGVRRNINVGLLKQEDSQVGDWVLIHVGFALSKIDEQEAEETLRLLQGMGQALSNEMQMMEESAMLRSFEP